MGGSLCSRFPRPEPCRREPGARLTPARRTRTISGTIRTRFAGWGMRKRAGKTGEESGRTVRKTLSGQWAGMAQRAGDDEDGGELDEAEVMGGQLLPARRQPADAIAPTVDGGPPRRGGGLRPPGGGSGRSARALGGMWPAGPRAAASSRRGVVVAAVEDQVGRGARLGGDDGGTLQCGPQRHIGPVGAGDQCRPSGKGLTQGGDRDGREQL